MLLEKFFFFWLKVTGEFFILSSGAFEVFLSKELGKELQGSSLPVNRYLRDFDQSIRALLPWHLNFFFFSKIKNPFINWDNGAVRVDIGNISTQSCCSEDKSAA